MMAFQFAVATGEKTWRVYNFVQCKDDCTYIYIYNYAYIILLFMLYLFIYLFIYLCFYYLFF